jgi:hypothetical protein
MMQTAIRRRNNEIIMLIIKPGQLIYNARIEYFNGAKVGFYYSNPEKGRLDCDYNL